MPLIDITGCDACSLKREWPNLTTPRMPMAAPRMNSPYRVLFLGEGPGKDEDREGRPFVGRTGKFLREYIPQDWQYKVHWQNVVRCFVSPRTHVLASTGYKELSKFKKGELVLTHNLRYKPVDEVLFFPGKHKFLNVSFDFEMHHCITPDHRYLKHDGSWVFASELHIGDSVMFLAEHCVWCGKSFCRHFGLYKSLPFCSSTCHNRYVGSKSGEAIRRSMLEQYSSGRRDRFAITQKANETVRKLISEGWRQPYEAVAKGVAKLKEMRSNGWIQPKLSEEEEHARRLRFALARQAAGIAGRRRAGHIGIGEHEVEAILQNAGYSIVPQFAIAGYNYDFLITDNNVIVEIVSRAPDDERNIAKRELAEHNGFKVVYVLCSHPESVLNLLENDDHLHELIALEVRSIKEGETPCGVWSLAVDDDESFIAQGAVHHNCRPPDNRTPSPREVACCAQYLRRDILNLRPHAILAIGAEAVNFCWSQVQSGISGEIPAISKLRGIPFPVQIGDFVCWAVGTYHPSYVGRAERENRSDGAMINPVLPVFRNDILRFIRNLDRFTAPPQIAIPTKHVVYPKSLEEAIALFHRLKQPYAKDYETRQLKPYYVDNRLLSAAFSDGDLTFAFPVDWPGDLNPWGREALRYIVEQDGEWIAQHATMEVLWTLAKIGKRKLKIHDTELLARLIHKRSGMGKLEVLSRIYLGVDIKELTNKTLAGQYLGPLEKSRLAEYTVEQILEYNAYDAWSEAIIFYKLLSFLPPDQLDNYYRSLETVKSTAEMELNGLTPNREEGARQEKILFNQMREFEKQARELDVVKEFEQKEQRPFSLSKPEAVGTVLVDYCHVALPETKDKNYSVDEKILEKIVDAHPLIPLRLDFVEIQKLKSTYVTPIVSGRILGCDGLIHGAYKVPHTATWRLSSEDPNMQNYPKRKHKEVRRLIVAPPGFIFAAFDYGQLEARTLVMASLDQALKTDFINKVDIHSRWLNRLIEIYPAYLVRLADKTGQKEEAKIRKAGRDIIKTDFVFASFYGSVAESISNRAMLPMVIAEQLLGEFWGNYSGVKRWIDGQFRFYQETGTVQSLTGRIRDEVIGGNEPINCVDYETEALTQRGWVDGANLQAGDILLTMNPNTHMLEWQSATEVRKFPDYEGPVHYLTGKSFSAVTTPEHRWMIHDGNYWREKTSASLPQYGSIPTVLPYNCTKTKRYSDDWIRLVGWVLTDGSYSGGGKSPQVNEHDYRHSKQCGYSGSQVLVCQTKEQFIPEIDDLFARLNIQFRTSKNRKQGDEVFWNFSGDSGRWFHGVFPNRTLTPEFLLLLTQEQLLILFDTMVKGDGWIEGSYSCFCAGKDRKDQVDAFQILSILCGKQCAVDYVDMLDDEQKQYASIANMPRTEGEWYATERKRKNIDIHYIKREIVEEKKGMWCPIVPNTFFVARRSGRVYITGNTPIQGTAAEIVLEAQTALYHKALDEDINFLPRINVHDDLIFLLPDDDNLENYIRVIGSEIVRPRFPFINLPLTTECRIGYTWADLESVTTFSGQWFENGQLVGSC